MKLAGWLTLIHAMLSSLSLAYDISLPPWDINYTDRVLAQQRAAGLKLVTELKEAKKYDSNRQGIYADAKSRSFLNHATWYVCILSSYLRSYVISAGVYRIGNALAIEGTTNLTIVAKNVEIISEFQGTTFSLIGNTNISIQGPLYLDADPFGTTQVSARPAPPSLRSSQVDIFVLTFINVLQRTFTWWDQNVRSRPIQPVPCDLQ